MTLEDMDLPCPLDACDGSGTVEDGFGNITKCPHADTDDRDEE